MDPKRNFLEQVDLAKWLMRRSELNEQIANLYEQLGGAEREQDPSKRTDLLKRVSDLEVERFEYTSTLFEDNARRLAELVLEMNAWVRNGGTWPQIRKGKA